MYKTYVYRLYNFANCKSYIGCTVCPERRFRQHLSRLYNGNHPNPEMQSDFNLYGDVFSFSVICEKTKFRQESEEFEWMKKLMTYDERYGYNTHDWAAQPMRKKHGLPCMVPSRLRKYGFA